MEVFTTASSAWCVPRKKTDFNRPARRLRMWRDLPWATGIDLLEATEPSQIEALSQSA